MMNSLPEHVRRLCGLGALLMLLALAGPAIQPVAAQGGAEAPLDLAAMMLTPADLAEEGLEDFGVGAGSVANAEEAAIGIAEFRDVPEEEVIDVLKDAEFVRVHEVSLYLPSDPSDPASPASTLVSSYIWEYETREGANAAWDYLEDEASIEGAEDIEGAESFGEISEITFYEGEDAVTGAPYQTLDLTILLDTLQVGVAIYAFDGEDEPEVEQVEALAEVLLDRVEAVREEGGPGLSVAVPRMTGVGVTTTNAAYVILDGDALTSYVESRQDRRARARVAANQDVTDEFLFEQTLDLGSDGTDAGVYYQAVLVRLTDEDAAASYLEGAVGQLEQDAADGLLDDLEIDELEAGDEALITSSSFASGEDRYESVKTILRLDSTVAILNLVGTGDIPLEAAEELAVVQAACLEDGDCLDPIPVPGALADLVESGESAEDVDDAEEIVEKLPKPSKGGGTVSASEALPAYRGGVTRTGEQPGPPPDGEPEEIWNFDTKDSFAGVSSPAVAEGLVFTGSNRLYGIDATAGDLVWELDSEASMGFIAPPAVANGVLYAAGEDGVVYALEPESGDVIWQTADPGGLPINSSPAIADGVIYFGGWDQKVYALKATYGEILWTAPVAGMINASAAVAEGVVFIAAGDNDGTLYALDAETGDERWSIETGGAVYASTVAVADGTVFMKAWDEAGTLLALDAETGEEIWAEPVGGQSSSSPAVVDSVLYVGAGNSNLSAFDAATGDEIWTVDLGAAVGSSPVLADGTLYVGDEAGIFHAIDAARGEELWALELTDAAILNSAAIVDGVIYVGDRAGVLHALGASESDESENGPEDETPDVEEEETRDAEEEETPEVDDSGGVDGDTYESPSFGYALEWDSAVWDVVEATVEDEYDTLALTNGTSHVYVYGFDWDGGAEACVESVADSLDASGSGVSDVEVREAITGDDEQAEASYTFMLDIGNDSGDDVEEVAFISCHTFDDGEHVVQVVHYAPEGVYEEEAELVEELLDELDLPA
jgi:outer membrane protein assembly factor BamB